MVLAIKNIFWLKLLISFFVSLPTRLGRLGIHDPSKETDFDYKDSKLVTANLTQAIFNQLLCYEEDKDAQATVMKEHRRRKDPRWKESWDGQGTSQDHRTMHQERSIIMANITAIKILWF